MLAEHFFKQHFRNRVKIVLQINFHQKIYIYSNVFHSLIFEVNIILAFPTSSH